MPDMAVNLRLFPLYMVKHSFFGETLMALQKRNIAAVALAIIIITNESRKQNPFGLLPFERGQFYYCHCEYA